MPSLATPEPTQITAGDSLAWRVVDPDHQAGAGWALAYTLVNAGGRISTISSTPDGDDHRISVNAATTAIWAPGRYRLHVAAINGPERVTLRTLDVEILPDPATAAPFDTRSHARRTLDALEAWIEGKNLAVASYRIADREMQHIPIPDLLQLRDRYRAEVRREEAAQRGHTLNRLQVRL